MGLFDFLKKKKADVDTAAAPQQAPEVKEEQPTAENTEGAEGNNSAE